VTDNALVARAYWHTGAVIPWRRLLEAAEPEAVRGSLHSFTGEFENFWSAREGQGAGDAAVEKRRV
jgi:hypothetical protein